MTSRRLLLITAAAAPLIAVATWSRSWWMSIAIVFASHMLLLYPTLRATSQWLGPVITHFDTPRREVWLTIDDGPGESTESVLALLQQQRVRATFFLIGDRVTARPELAKRIIESGHTIGNHSATHPSGRFWMMGKSALAGEIENGARMIETATGYRPVLFRAPVGMKNPFVHPLLAARGMHLVAWSARAFDTVFPGERSAKRIASSLVPGAIILLHEGTRAVGGGTIDPALLDATINAVKRAGFEFVIPEVDQLRAGRRATTT